MSDNPEIRLVDPDNEDSAIDEIVCSGVEMLHVEQLSDSQWWCGVTMNDGRIFGSGSV